MKKLLSLFVFLFCVEAAHAQFPDLPGLNTVIVNAQVLLKWNTQYQGLQFIAIQRSADSIRNFATIGKLNAPKKGQQFYKDEKPLPGRNFYRLQISLGEDVIWYSNVAGVVLDSALAIAQQNAPTTEPGNAGTQQQTQENVITNPVTTKNSVEPKVETPPPPPKPVPFTFVPSNQIYTSPYTGHVSIQLPDVAEKNYKLIFYDHNKQEVLRVSRIQESLLILDKNNFNRRGVYAFTLFNGTDIIEQGYVQIQ